MSESETGYPCSSSCLLASLVASEPRQWGGISATLAALSRASQQFPAEGVPFQARSSRQP